jgi:hypothetical protein
MIPNLLEATHQYWRKLDELEASYQRGEVTLEEVDAQVAVLMSDLGRDRRAALQFFFSNLGRVWDEQRETVLGVVLISVLTVTWVATNS